MDKELFKQRLSEVAEFRMPKLSPSDIKEAGQRARGRGRPTKESLYQDLHEVEFLDLFQGHNPTMVAELVKVNIKPHDCEDCGQHLTVSREMQIKFYRAMPGHISHRRDRCVTCNRYRDPNTGEFTLPQGPACQVYLNWAKAEFSARNKQAKKDLAK
jgi:hypothetical protein